MEIDASGVKASVMDNSVLDNSEADNSSAANLSPLALKPMLAIAVHPFFNTCRSTCLSSGWPSDRMSSRQSSAPGRSLGLSCALGFPARLESFHAGGCGFPDRKQSARKGEPGSARSESLSTRLTQHRRGFKPRRRLFKLTDSGEGNVNTR